MAVPGCGPILVNYHCDPVDARPGVQRCGAAGPASSHRYIAAAATAEAMTFGARSHALCMPSAAASLAVNALSTSSATSMPGPFTGMRAALRTALPSPHAARVLQCRNASCSSTTSLMSAVGVVPAATTTASNSMDRAVAKVRSTTT